MIGRLTGCVEDCAGRSFILNCQGVGYELQATTALSESLIEGETRTIIVYTDVKEDSIRFFGFMDKLEKQVFNLLLQVNGIGAKSALDIVSAIDKRELLRAIGAGDIARLQAVKGIGKKTAERLVVELRERVGEHAAALTEPGRALGPTISRGADAKNQVFSDAHAALMALGFARQDADRALAQAGPGISDSGELVKQALRFV